MYHGPNRHRSLFVNTDLVITTYETLRSDWRTEGHLFSTPWYRVVLDEGHKRISYSIGCYPELTIRQAHHIRNRSSQIFKAAYALKSSRRWCLTGTPIHNSIDDFGALLAFLHTPSFEDKSAFDFWISRPMKMDHRRGLEPLKALIKTICLRRTKSQLKDACELTTRTERIDYVKLKNRDQTLYDFFKLKCSKVAQGLLSKGKFPSDTGKDKEENFLSLLLTLRLVCDHGEQILPQPAQEVWMSSNDRVKAVEAQIHSGLSTASGQIHPSRSIANGHYSSSAKVVALLCNLRNEQSHEIQRTAWKPIKSVVFSYWTKMLDLIEPILKENGYNSARIDGSTSLESRFEALRQFNNNSACTVMLASISSCGEGVDFTAATHVHLIEPQWNPMVEAQAIDRIHRIGQEYDVTVTRYITPDSIETYIQTLQIEKLSVINRSLESHNSASGEEECEERWDNLQAFLAKDSITEE
ncbi:MAG: hypothetical protein M1814_002785 [Vezdaea aestivalis]|nr:MAG: hypothetical protein M1814_002785 [Vezdaea aestivalis]